MAPSSAAASPRLPATSANDELGDNARPTVSASAPSNPPETVTTNCVPTDPAGATGSSTTEITGGPVTETPVRTKSAPSRVAASITSLVRTTHSRLFALVTPSEFESPVSTEYLLDAGRSIEMIVGPVLSRFTGLDDTLFWI